MKVLITGSSGLIGRAIARYLHASGCIEVQGVGRRPVEPFCFDFPYRDFGDLCQPQATENLVEEYQPDVIINCAGATKHIESGNDPAVALPLNSMLPHQISKLAYKHGFKLIHISTDCVFNGRRGYYSEEDFTDAYDVYGKSKAMGELISGDHLVLRTSTIGHECGTKRGLLDWFISQKTKCLGYKEAYFSGLPTTEIARLILEEVLPRRNLNGLINLGGQRIDKFSLLKMLRETYALDIEIIPDASVKIDRSLNCKKFFDEVGYTAPPWSELLKKMQRDWQEMR